MITFSNLGYHGRLGNQMFQYASIIGIAKKNGYDYCFPLHRSSLSRWFDLTTKDQIFKLENMYNEQMFNFQPIVFDLPDNVDYVGYFQTEKYFEHCSSFIRNEFRFKNEIFIDVQETKNIEEPPKIMSGIDVCGKCYKDKDKKHDPERGTHTTYYELQTRSQDEPMTRFVECID